MIATSHIYLPVKGGSFFGAKRKGLNLAVIISAVALDIKNCTVQLVNSSAVQPVHSVEAQYMYNNIR